MRRILAAACLAVLTGGLLAALSRGRGQLAAARHGHDRLAAERRALLHDMRGTLSPLLMAADRLSTHADPKVVRMANLMIARIDQATRRLKR